MRLIEPNINFLKLIAVVSMVIDHSNKIVLSGEYDILSSIGRLAFPLFAFILVYNYLYHTRSPLRYTIRLLVFAIISQPIYTAAFNIDRLNILFTLGLGLFILHLCVMFAVEKLGFAALFSVWILHIVNPSFAGLQPLWVEFGLDGLLLIYALSLFLRAESPFAGAVVIVSLLRLNYIGELSSKFVQQAIFSLISVFVVRVSGWITNRLNEVLRFRYFFYIFYPAHLLLLIFIAGI